MMLFASGVNFGSVAPSRICSASVRAFFRC
jgi:hypothetical protein